MSLQDEINLAGLATILLSASLLLAGDAVNNPGCVDDGHSVGVGDLHLLALLYLVTGGAVTTLLHPLGKLR